MTVSPSFPPVDAFLAFMRRVDYIKHLNSFMDTVEQICLIIAAFVVVCARKWCEHQVTERLQIFAAFAIVALVIVSEFVRETVWPLMRQNAQNVWRFLYTIAQPPLTV